MLNRNEKGVEALFDNYSNTIFGIISRIVKDNNIAEEVLQSSMLKAWNKIHQYDSKKSSLYTWLATIARNSAIDIVRRRSYSNQQKTDSFDIDVHKVETVNLSQSEIDVKNLVSKLDDKYKILLKLVYLEGYTQSDAAKHLNIPLGTVKTRLRSALLILRKDLKNEKDLFRAFMIILLIMLLLLP